MQEITEEQMMEIAQRCFEKIAKLMKEKNITLNSLYGSKLEKKVIENKEVEVISPEVFLSGLKKLGIQNVENIDYTCLTKMLAMNDEETFIKLSDLSKILKDFGITKEGTETEEEEISLNYTDLDKVSVVILLALTEYLVNSNIPLYELFGETIYKQAAQIDNKEIQLDLINSPDFFSTLKNIGINTENNEHENLKSFLCLDPAYPDKISVAKLKKSIEEFAVNEELKKYAQQCYHELVEDNQVAETNTKKQK